MFSKIEKYLVLILLSLSFITLFLGSRNEETLKIGECVQAKTLTGNYKFLPEERKIVGKILSNCGIKEYKLVEMENKYLIVEIGREEELLRCVCNRHFEIENAKDLDVYHLPFGEKEAKPLQKISD